VRRRGALVLALVAPGCGALTLTAPTGERCTGYPPAASSPYVLPFPVGISYVVAQGNCSGYGHSGFWKYSYDFAMPIGSVVTAARAGVVFVAVGIYPDTGPHDMTVPPNLVLVRHDDSTVAVYSHLMHDGVRVQVGQVVAAGDTLALSGNSGYTGGFPHLHFSIHACDRLPGFSAAPDCPAVPMTFANARPRILGPLITHLTYRAVPQGVTVVR
jgi:murein DD-endopeptidase MepM/ murein hydrolase activator NlpD